ncbi:MAG: caspase family protein [Gammaproteobacteria bacterium]
MSKKHALIVGIDKYSKLDPEYQLSGCVNDAKLMRNVLVEHFHFDPANVLELYNADASRAGLTQGMDALVGRVEQDDIVVFHFSGHGSRRTGRTPNEEEGSGKDSTIMPSDSGRRPHPNLDIVDDDINKWLQRLTANTENVTLIFDCCHSGTITRDAFGAQARSVPDDNRSLEEMGVEVGDTVQPATRGNTSSARGLTLNDRYVVLSGCRDNEVSHEYTRFENGEEFRNGALTHFLTSAMLRATPGTTYRDVFEYARQSVRAKFSSQNPQIEGRQERELLGTRDIEPLRYVSVKAIDGDAVTLAGGAAHGLHRGARWTVYPPGTKTIEGAVALAVVDVNAVGPLASEATVIERHGDVPVTARCVETSPSTEQFVTQVDLSQLPATERQLFDAAIGESDLLSASDTGAAVRLYVLEPREQVDDSSPVPQLASVPVRTFAIVDRQGQLQGPVHPVDEDGVVELLVKNLETLARYQNALVLDCPNANLDVEFNILRQNENNEWVSANGGDQVFHPGDRLAFEIINNDDRAVFASVLDFGLTGRVSLLYPPRRAGEMIDPGHTLRIGVRQKIKLSIPDDMPGTEGVETYKCLVATDETDFRWLQQDGMRSGDFGPSQLRRQFSAAYHGPTTRDSAIEMDDSDAEDEDVEWKSVNRAFILRRQ